MSEITFEERARKIDEELRDAFDDDTVVDEGPAKMAELLLLQQQAKASLLIAEQINRLNNTLDKIIDNNGHLMVDAIMYDPARE